MSQSCKQEVGKLPDGRPILVDLSIYQTWLSKQLLPFCHRCPWPIFCVLANILEHCSIRTGAVVFSCMPPHITCPVVSRSHHVLQALALSAEAKLSGVARGWNTPASRKDKWTMLERLGRYSIANMAHSTTYIHSICSFY